MTTDSITTVLSVVAWGTKLTFSLYDFAVAHPGASQDISRLAKEVNLLSQVLRQIGSRLKEDGSLPSPQAFDVVRAVLDQCQDCFREIENLVPFPASGTGSRASSRPGSYDGSTTAQQQLMLPSRPGTYDTGAVTVSSPSSPYVMVASPVREGQREDGVEWNSVVQARAVYLLAHLEALKLTMSVMLQTLYTARAIVWARCDGHQTAFEAMDVEKLQTESLVVEQQLALLRVHRFYDNFRRQSSNNPLLLESSPQSQALIRRDTEYGPTPRALIAYQEASLANSRPSSSEMDDLSRIRRISGPYVDVLLSNWTRMRAIEERYRIASPPRDSYQRRNWRPTAVESDSEDSPPNSPYRPPRLHLSTTEPVLMHVNEPSHLVSSPISAVPRSATLQPPGGPFSPQPSHSWGPTSGTYFPQVSGGGNGKGSNPARRRVVSPTPSPLASPRVSFSTADAPPRMQTAFKPDEQRGAPTPMPKLTAPTATETNKDQPQGIPYRLRINQWYWDYSSSVLVDSNLRGMTPQQAIKTVSKDTMAITELFQTYVSREAIRKAGLEYTKVMRERVLPGSGKVVEEQCYAVEGALRPEEVAKLVERTRRFRGEDERRRDREREGSRMSPRSRLAPAFERANTAPILGNKFRETHPREVEAATRRENTYPSSSSRDKERDKDKLSATSASTNSDSDTAHHKSRSSSSRPRSKSRHRHDSPRGSWDDDYSRDRDRERGSSRARSRDDRERDGNGKRKSGSAKMQTATKIAAGAGLATLLDGLPEVLSYL